MIFHRTLLLATLLPVTAAFAQRAGAAAAAREPAADPLIEALRAAPDPSLAIEAYARASAAGTIAPLALERIYVQHMVDHGAPELADAQARGLLRRGAGDATVRGVVAYNDAARGDVPNAVRNLKLGLTQRPEDPFLLRTAGQIVAWYVLQADRSGLSKDDVAAIEWLRTAGKKNQDFEGAFRMASDARQPAATGTAPTTQGSSAGGASEGNYGSGGGSGSGSGYGNSGSTSGSSSYPYSCESLYYGYAYGAAYSAIAVRDRDFRRDRQALDPRNPAIGPGDRAGDGRGADPRGGSPPPGGAQPPAQPQQAAVRPPQAPARAPQMPARPPSPPPGPPHP